MFSYARDFTPDVEQASIDEGYFDLSGCRRPPAEVAREIRVAIEQSLKISVSEGVGSSKFVSAVASKLRKPAAFVEVPVGREAEFLEPLSSQPRRWSCWSWYWGVRLRGCGNLREGLMIVRWWR
jgi:DNA polymerase-4